MKRFVIVVALACALSSTALAGNIPTGGLTADEPTTPETTTPGDIPSTGSTSLIAGSDPAESNDPTNNALAMLMMILGIVV